jgi:hypothetical protein
METYSYNASFNSPPIPFPALLLFGIDTTDTQDLMTKMTRARKSGNEQLAELYQAELARMGQQSVVPDNKLERK